MHGHHVVIYPSAKPLEIGLPCAIKWIAQGYRVLMGVNTGMVPSPFATPGGVNYFQLQTPFQGYYRVINTLVGHAFHRMGAELVTCIGDDMLPPEWADASGGPVSAQAMGSRYFARFPHADGVMQPCGDPGGSEMIVPGFEHLGPIKNAARICGSPVFGINWAARAGGPFNQVYRSFYADEDLWRVATLEGKLWLDFRTMHRHLHWTFNVGTEKQPYHEKAQENWAEDQAIFERRKAERFGVPVDTTGVVT